MQAEYEEEAATSAPATKRVNVAVMPTLLYIVFLCAAAFYTYARITFGMQGLAGNLRVYSAFVLAVELLGILNMAFYGVWLFARPNNRDIWDRKDETVRPCGCAFT